MQRVPRQSGLLVLILAVAGFAGLSMTAVRPALAQEHQSASPSPGIDYEGERERVLQHLREDKLSPDEVRAWITFAEDIKKAAKEDLSFAGRLKRALANPWVLFGFAAQGIFMMRFVVQIIASERKKKSYVPVAFWYLSLAGGLMLFIYAVRLRDPVFVLGQGLGLLIYARNLVLIGRRSNDYRDRLAERDQRGQTSLEPGPEAT
jgi:lipid-A-disaccharide synthase-like uncharacterized protein